MATIEASFQVVRIPFEVEHIPSEVVGRNLAFIEASYLAFTEASFQAFVVAPSYPLASFLAVVVKP